jgi:hypothetical protein
MSEEEIRKVASILNKWNPLGAKAESIPDLDGYRTEAIDIISALTVFEKLRNPRDVVMNGLNDAFELDLTPEECERPVHEILVALGRDTPKGSARQTAPRDRAKRGA